MNSKQQSRVSDCESNEHVLVKLREELIPHLGRTFRARDGLTLYTESLALSVIPSIETAFASSIWARRVGKTVRLAVRLAPRLMKAPENDAQHEADIAIMVECLEKLHSEQSTARVAACQKLGQLGCRGARPGLKQALSDRDAEVRTAARQALTDIDAPRLPQDILANQCIKLSINRPGSAPFESHTDRHCTAFFEHVPADTECGLQWSSRSAGITPLQPVQPVSEPKSDEPSLFNLLSVMLGVFRNPIYAGLTALLIALPFGWFIGRQTALPLEQGARLGGDSNYGVATLENLLAPNSNRQDELKADIEVLIDYLKKHPDDHWFRVRLIQICRAREHLLPDGQQKKELSVFIQSQRDLLPDRTQREASDAPYP